MDSDSDNQSDSTEQMDESDDLDDLRVNYAESADILIRNFNRKSSFTSSSSLSLFTKTQFDFSEPNEHP